MSTIDTSYTSLYMPFSVTNIIVDTVRDNDDIFANDILIRNSCAQ